MKGRVIDLSKFGARVEIAGEDLPFHAGERISQAKVVLKDVKVFSGPISIANEVKAEGEIITYGLILGGTGVDLVQIKAILEIERNVDIILGTKKILEFSSQVDPTFKVLVADLSTLFQDLKFKLGEEERISKIKQSENHRKRLDEHIINVAMSLYSDDIQRIFDGFKAVTEKFDVDQTQIHKRYFRISFHPMVLGTPFVDCGFHKPLGYAEFRHCFPTAILRPAGQLIENNS